MDARQPPGEKSEKPGGCHVMRDAWMSCISISACSVLVPPVAGGLAMRTGQVMQSAMSSARHCGHGVRDDDHGVAFGAIDEPYVRVMHQLDQLGACPWLAFSRGDHWSFCSSQTVL